MDMIRIIAAWARKRKAEGRPLLAACSLLLAGRARGQTMVFVGLLVGLGVLTGFVALAADGGSALLQRRNMQNGADAAALGAVQTLGASVVLSSGVGIYIITNSGLADRVEQAAEGNRGGFVGSPLYTTTLEYGT